MYFSILRNFGSNVTKGHFKRKHEKVLDLYGISLAFL